jgi:hypothetical protein
MLSMIAIVAIWWLFDSGRLVYSASGQRYLSVCDKGIVDRYNDAMYYKVRTGSIDPSIDEAGVKGLVAEIQTKKDFENDPTCQSIIFWSAVQENNYSSANTSYNILMDLHDKHIFADSNLRSSQPLFMYGETLKGLSGSGFSEEDVFGS